MYYDIHSHLNDNKIKNIKEIIEKMEENRIITIINGLNYKDNKIVKELSKKSNNLFYSYGMFPLDDFDKRIFNQIRKDNPISIGEVGLDFSIKNEKNITFQIKHFLEIINLAKELNKTLIIHSRNAEKKVIELLPKIEVPCVLHYFSGNKSLINQAKEYSNVYFSISANSEYNKHEQMKIKNIDIKKLVCETDSPYLWKYGINTPLNIKFAYNKISELKKISLKNIEKEIEKTIKKLFKNIK